jgi:hypothetical protein
MKKHISIAALLCVSVLASCGPDALQTLTVPPFTSARVRFYNFGINDPGVNFFADTLKLTSVSNTLGVDSTAGTAYSAVAPANGDYVQVSPGAHTLIAKLSGDAGLAHPTIASVTQTIVDGHFYSFYTSGFYNATAKTVEAFVVEDPFTVPADFVTANVRFVNASPNSSPMILYAKNQTTLLETAIGAVTAYKSAGAFTSLAAGVYDLSTRLAGSSTNIFTRTSVSFSGGKVYTISARGDITVTSTTATNRPFLDNTANY